MHEAPFESIDDDGLQIVEVDPEIFDGKHQLVGHGRVADRPIVGTDGG